MWYCRGFRSKNKASVLRPQVWICQKNPSPGPDWSGIFSDEHVLMAHERLAIVDPQSGGQPLYSEDKNLILAVNGEIYNHQELRKELNDYTFWLIQIVRLFWLYIKKGIHFWKTWTEFMRLHSTTKSTIVILSRGITWELFRSTWVWDTYGNFYVASELKSTGRYLQQNSGVLPGHYLYSKNGHELQKWYTRDWMQFENVKDNSSDISNLRQSLKPLFTVNWWVMFRMEYFFPEDWIHLLFLLSRKVCSQAHRIGWYTDGVVSSIAFFCSWIERVAGSRSCEASCSAYQFGSSWN